MNNIYQWIYFKIIKNIIPVAKTGQKIDVYFLRMFWQIKIAKLFRLKRIIIGDSNAENENIYATMKLFKKTTVNFCRGGTTVDDWIDFFNLPNGVKILNLISRYEIIINLGGNNLLLNKLDGICQKFYILKVMFPNAWFYRLMN
jgi:hypothetical protein